MPDDLSAPDVELAPPRRNIVDEARKHFEKTGAFDDVRGVVTTRRDPSPTETKLDELIASSKRIEALLERLIDVTLAMPD